MRRPVFLLLSLGATLVAAASVRAERPADFLAAFEAEARRAEPGFEGFSAERGARFFAATHGGDWSCASCHSPDPAAVGEHAVTGKPIEPLAPAANPERFTRARSVEKWFRRNCNDVLERECTAREKGDVLAYLLSVGR